MSVLAGKLHEMNHVEIGVTHEDYDWPRRILCNAERAVGSPLPAPALPALHSASGIGVEKMYPLGVKPFRGLFVSSQSQRLPRPPIETVPVPIPPIGIAI